MSLITSPPSFVLSRPPGHPPWPASSNSFCRRSRSCSAFSARTFHASCETSSRSTALTASLSAPTSLIASSPILRVCSAVSTSAPRYRTSRPRPRPTAAPRASPRGPCPPLGPTLELPRCRLPPLAPSSSRHLHRSRYRHRQGIRHVRAGRHLQLQPRGHHPRHLHLVRASTARDRLLHRGRRVPSQHARTERTRQHLARHPAHLGQRQVGSEPTAEAFFDGGDDGIRRVDGVVA